MNPVMHDIGAYLTGVNAFNPVTLNANSTSEHNVAQNGVTIDRELLRAGFPTQLSGQLCVPFSYSLVATATASVTAKLQHSSSSTAWANYTAKDGSTNTVKTVGSAGSTATQTGNSQVRVNYDLGAAKRYIRCVVTADFVGTTTADDADVGGVFTFGGYQVTPASTAGV